MAAAQMRILVLILWILPHAALIPCIVGMIRTSEFKRMRFFFVYMVWEELVFAVLLSIVLWQSFGGGPAGLYQPVMMVGNVGIGSCLQLAVFYEVVNTLVLPHSPALAALGPLIRWAAAVAILVAVATSAAVSYSGLRPVTHIFEALNFSANLVNLGLLILLLIFTRTFHVSWKSLPAGIALGFGVNSSVEVGVASLVSALGAKSIDLSDVVRMSAYLACTVIWLAYVFMPESRPRFSGQGLQKSELEVWNQELQKMNER